MGNSFKFFMFFMFGAIFMLLTLICANSFKIEKSIDLIAHRLQKIEELLLEREINDK